MKNNNFFTKSLFLIAIFIGFTSFAQTAKSNSQNALQVLKDSGSHTVFLNLLKKSDFMPQIKGEQSITILAPSDEAFKGMHKEELQKLKNSKSALNNLVSLHIFPGDWTIQALKDRLSDQSGKMLMKNINNTTTEFFLYNADVYFYDPKGNKIKLSKDISTRTDHGIIYSLDTVLVPRKK